MRSGEDLQHRGAASSAPARRAVWLVRILYVACCVTCISSAVLIAQTKPLERHFRAGTVATFRVELRIRSEVEGQKPVTIGAKTYIQSISQWVEQKLIWQSERRVASLADGGAAEIEEKLDGFSSAETSSNDDPATRKLLDALVAAVKPWETPRILRYREMPDGKIAGLDGEAAPPVDEASPRVLTAWLLRALRPTVALPVQPVAYNKPWQGPRAVQFVEWPGTTGSESGEWLSGAAAIRAQGEPIVQLHSTVEISGTVGAGAEKPSEGSAQAHFHAESLSALSLEDLRLMQATRSAVREVVVTLAPVEGLPAPPQFRGRLLAEIRIQNCDESPCSFDSDSGVRDHR